MQTAVQRCSAAAAAAATLQLQAAPATTPAAASNSRRGSSGGMAAPTHPQQVQVMPVKRLPQHLQGHLVVALQEAPIGTCEPGVNTLGVAPAWPKERCRSWQCSLDPRSKI